MSIMEISSRIAEIQGRFGAPVGIGISPSGTAFAETLGSVSDGGNGAGGAVDGPTDGTTGEDAVLSAEKYLGVPYKYGGTDPESGLDCSGFVQRAYADLGVQLPRVAKDQAAQGLAVPSLAQAEPGDLVAFGKPVSHIGIYLGDNKMIVAPHTGDKVKIEDVYTTPTAIRRLLPSATDSASGGSGGGGPVVRPPALSSTVPYSSMFSSAATKYGVPAPLLAAVAKVESGYNPDAVSKSGAEGLMQIMPGTANGLGIDPLDPQQAINGAAQLLSRNLKSFGSVDLALAAYNAGGGAVRKYNGIPPYAETQAYVPKVRAAMADLGVGGGSMA